MIKSEQITEGVRISVQSAYVPERSKPDDDYYFFAYRVHIQNESNIPVKLLSRHWKITDGHGQTEEVRGPGVVGEQPVLAQGQAFSYTSACPLSTPVGAMCGTYQMLGANGHRFDAEIAPFSLAYPDAVH